MLDSYFLSSVNCFLEIKSAEIKKRPSFTTKPEAIIAPSLLRVICIFCGCTKWFVIRSSQCVIWFSSFAEFRCMNCTTLHWRVFNYFSKILTLEKIPQNFANLSKTESRWQWMCFTTEWSSAEFWTGMFKKIPPICRISIMIVDMTRIPFKQCIISDDSGSWQENSCVAFV